jgi:hypothetical protein
MHAVTLLGLFLLYLRVNKPQPSAAAAGIEKKGFRFDTFPVLMKSIAFARVTGARISATANLRYATI